MFRTEKNNQPKQKTKQIKKQNQTQKPIMRQTHTKNEFLFLILTLNLC